MENQLNEKEKKYLRFIIIQQKQRVRIVFSSVFSFFIGVFVLITGFFLNDPELSRTGGMIMTISLMLFLWIRRERKVIDIVKKIYTNTDLE